MLGQAPASGTRIAAFAAMHNAQPADINRPRFVVNPPAIARSVMVIHGEEPR
jgi:hypothetical protein